MTSPSFFGQESLSPRHENWICGDDLTGASDGIPNRDGLRKFSYKDSLLNCEEGPGSMQRKIGRDLHGEKVFLSFEEDVDISSFTRENAEGSRPNIKARMEEEIRMGKPFHRALIVKLLGKTVGYNFLKHKLDQMRAKNGSLTLVDLGKAYLTV